MNRRLRVIASGIFVVGAFSLLAAQDPSTDAAVLSLQASFVLPSSSPSLRLAGVDFVNNSTWGLFVSGKGEAAYAEVVTTDLTGTLQARVMLSPPPTKATGLAVSSDHRMALSGKDGSVRVYTPSGAQDTSANLPDKSTWAMFADVGLAAVTNTGVTVVDPVGSVRRFAPPSPLSWPLSMALLPSSDDLAVVELGQPALNILSFSRGVWRRVALTAPELQEARSQDSVVPAALAVTVARDSGRIFAAANPIANGAVTVLEFDSSGVLKARYSCPLRSSQTSPSEYLIPGRIRAFGNFLAMDSPDDKTVSIYRLPG